jgi:hypothetical protein
MQALHTQRFRNSVYKTLLCSPLPRIASDFWSSLFFPSRTCARAAQIVGLCLCETFFTQPTNQHQGRRQDGHQVRSPRGDVGVVRHWLSRHIPAGCLSVEDGWSAKLQDG